MDSSTLALLGLAAGFIVQGFVFAFWLGRLAEHVSLLAVALKETNRQLEHLDHCIDILREHTATLVEVGRRLERGERGATGERGETGATGATGPSGEPWSRNQ